MIAQTAGRIRGQIERFSGKLCAGLSKPGRRFVHEMIQGILSRQSVRLSEVVRSLEERVRFIKTETRLSRNLARPELRPVLQAALAREGASRIGPETLLVLDVSDLVKPYGRKMEYLARVRDGSDKKLADGYWTVQVIGVEPEGNEITPLYGELYSSKAEDFTSENDELLKAMGQVSLATGGRGIWVIDRGGDRGRLYDQLVPPEHGLRFLIRLKGDRHLERGGERRAAWEWAARCPQPYATDVVREERGEERAVHLSYGFLAVRLPEYPDVPLWLVVVSGFGADPLLLLTNLPQRKKQAAVWRTVRAYLTRWRVEETIRFCKQGYRLEDVRVRSYQRLRTLFVLVQAVLFFATVVLGASIRLRILAAHVLGAAKRFFGLPDFRGYALADGIRELLCRFPKKKSAPKPWHGPPTQLTLIIP